MNLKKILESVGLARTEVDKSEKKLERFKQERDALIFSALPMPDFIALLHEYIDLEAGRYSELLKQQVKHLIHKPFTVPEVNRTFLLGFDGGQTHSLMASQAGFIWSPETAS